MIRASAHHLAFLLTTLVAACPGGDPGTTATGTTTTTAPDGTDGGSTTSQGVTESTGAPTGTSTTTGGPDVPTGTGLTTGTTAVDTGTTADATSEPTTAEPETTMGGSTMGGACVDSSPEPSDVEEQAVPLPDQGCLNEDEEFFGALAAGDVDWYTYHAALACDLEAMHARVSLSQPLDGRLCLFVACDVGPVELECPPTAMPSSSPNGVDGCCTEGSAVNLAFACPAADNHSARLLFRLDGADACVEYSGTTGFSWRG